MFVDEKAAGEVQTAEEANRKMKLSEAIRIGAKLLPQGRGKYYEKGRTCAIGAAFHAIHGHPSGQMDAVDFASGLHEKYGIQATEIFYLNDTGWTREQIADWLESQGY